MFGSSLQIGLFLLLFSVLTGCSSDLPSNTFGEYLNQEIRESDRAYVAKSDSEQALTLVSPSMKIDRIFRSMQGPFEYNDAEIPSNDDLIWLVGYKGKVTSNIGAVSEGYMGHNNLDLLRKEDNPWRVRTLGTNTRIFTLTQGQCELYLPDGFGIPMPSDAKLQMSSQVLNHNEPDIDLVVQHEIEVFYKNQSQLSRPLIPLYQQAIFVTKQTSGPEGAYGEELQASYPTLDQQGITQCVSNCEIEYDGMLNPYQDQFGRTFSGHWQIDPAHEVVTSNVTKMMNLEFDTKIHFISLHVHPFAESLKLMDITTGEVVYEGRVENFEDKIGLSNIDYFSSIEGLPVYAQHDYELISTYRQTDTANQHTAMATMFLYLADK